MANKHLYFYDYTNGNTLTKGWDNTEVLNYYDNPHYMWYYNYYNEQLITFTPEFDKNLEITLIADIRSVSGEEKDYKFLYKLLYSEELQSYMFIKLKLVNSGRAYDVDILDNNGKVQWNMYQQVDNPDIYNQNEPEFVLYDNENIPYNLIPESVTIISIDDIWNHNEFPQSDTTYQTSRLITNTTSDNRTLYFYTYGYYGRFRLGTYDWYPTLYITNTYKDYEWEEVGNSTNIISINDKICVGIVPDRDSTLTDRRVPLTTEGTYGRFNRTFYDYNQTIDTLQDLPEHYRDIGLIRFIKRSYTYGGYDETTIALTFYNEQTDDILIMYIPLQYNLDLLNYNIKFKGSSTAYEFGYYSKSNSGDYVTAPNYGPFCFIISRSDSINYTPYYSDDEGINSYKQYVFEGKDEPLYIYSFGVWNDVLRFDFHNNTLNKDFIEHFIPTYIGGNMDGIYLDDEYIEKTPIHYDPEEELPSYYEYDGEYYQENDSQTVIQDLENAFKEDEREIKAYIKIEYNKPIYSDGALEITNASPQGTIYDNGLGYISTNTTKDNPTMQIELTIDNTLIESNTRNITLYFIENIPKNLTITDNNNINITITNNESEVVNVDLGSNLGSSLTITANNWSLENKKIRLENIELGFNEIYKNEEIINMNIIEETRKFCEETPDNDLDVTINNYDGKFDTLNPVGVAQYLTKNSVIKPYLGANTEDGVKYVNMGKFYLDSWNNNSDGTTTLRCKNLIKKISDLDINVKYNEIGVLGNGTRIVDNVELINPSLRLSNYLLNTYNIKNNITTEFDDKEPTDSTLYPINWDYINNVKLLKYLQDFSIAFKRILYCSREEILKINPIDTTIKQIITDNELLEEPKVDKIKKINTIKLILKSYIQGENWYQEDPFIHKIEQKFIATSTDNNIVEVISTTPFPTGLNNGYFNITTSSGTIEEYRDILNRNQNGVFIKFFKLSGVSIGDEITIVCNYTHNLTENTKEQIIQENNIDEENTLEFSNNLISEVNNNTINNLMQYYLDNAVKYNVEFEFNGNAYIKAGDVVTIQTKYGDMDIFIESITHKYDGGYNCSVKGVDV